MSESGNISGGADGAFYDAGTSLTLQATPPVSIDASSRYRFDHWSGDASGATNPVSVTVSGPTSVTAHYVTQYKLTLTTNPSGVGVGNISGGTNGAFYDAGLFAHTSGDDSRLDRCVEPLPL